MLDQEAGESEDYYLVASCKGEDTYGAGCLFLVPSYDFCMIYSSTDFMIIRTHANAERDNTTVGDNRGRTGRADAYSVNTQRRSSLHQRETCGHYAAENGEDPRGIISAQACQGQV